MRRTGCATCGSSSHISSRLSLTAKSASSESPLRQSRAEAREPLRAFRGLGLFSRDEVEHADAVLLLLVDVEVVRQLDAAHERRPAAEF